MYRTVTLLLAVMFSPAVVTAQQPCTPDARAVVNELYRHMLERSAGDASATWVEQLEGGRMNVRDVVREIAKSPEHVQRFHYTEAGEGTLYERSVARLYRHILGRQPDAAGQRGHAELAQRGGSGAVVDSIIDSREYDQQFGDWGVPGSGGIRYCRPGTRASGEGAVAPDASLNQSRMRDMDRNNDGVITRNEWRGNRQSFDVRDGNNDGVLTGTEVDEAPAVAASRSLIRVSGNERWTDTGIDVRAGDMLSFDTQGTVQLSDNRNDTAVAGGARNGRRAADAPFANQSAGALIAQIGNGQALFIGNRRALRVPVSGRLYLGVNDDHLADNAGDFQVTVTVLGR